MPEIGTPGLMWRGLETGPWGPYTGTKLETAETAKGNLPVPRQSSTLLAGGASGNVATVELGTHLTIERVRLVTLHLPRARSSSTRQTHRTEVCPGRTSVKADVFSGRQTQERPTRLQV